MMTKLLSLESMEASQKRKVCINLTQVNFLLGSGIVMEINTLLPNWNL